MRSHRMRTGKIMICCIKILRRSTIPLSSTLLTGNLALPFIGSPFGRFEFCILIIAGFEYLSSCTNSCQNKKKANTTLSDGVHLLDTVLWSRPDREVVKR